MANDWRRDDDRFGYRDDRFRDDRFGYRSERDRGRDRGPQSDLGWGEREARRGSERYSADFGREREMNAGRSSGYERDRNPNFSRGEYGYDRSDWGRADPVYGAEPVYGTGGGWRSQSEASGGYNRTPGYGWGESYGSDDAYRRGRDPRSGYGSGYGYGYGSSSGSGYGGPERSFWDRASDEVSSWFGDDEAERRRRMDDQRSHRGRGPKGYMRSDERIREDVSDALSDDPLVDATEIEVLVVGGEVTLSGTVESRFAKRRAEDCAERISGVNHVQNNLRARAPAAGGYASETSSASSGQTASSGSSTAGSKQRV